MGNVESVSSPGTSSSPSETKKTEKTKEIEGGSFNLDEVVHLPESETKEKQTEDDGESLLKSEEKNKLISKGGANGSTDAYASWCSEATYVESSEESDRECTKFPIGITKSTNSTNSKPQTSQETKAHANSDSTSSRDTNGVSVSEVKSGDVVDTKPKRKKLYMPVKERIGKHDLGIGTIQNRTGSVDSTAEKAKKIIGPKIVIGRFTVLDCIGKGAQGVVNRCFDPETGDIVAIKTIQNHRDVWRKSSSSSRAMQEVELLKSCNHRNLVRFIEAFNDHKKHQTHLVLEFIDAVTLDGLEDEVLLKGQGTPLEEDYSRELFRQLVSALQYLHHHHILHRDIKPSNLLIDRETGVLKVSDFGIALRSKKEKALRVLGRDDNLIAMGNIYGTPAFLPPEYYRILIGDETASSLYVPSNMDSFGSKSARTHRKKYSLKSSFNRDVNSFKENYTSSDSVGSKNSINLRSPGNSINQSSSTAEDNGKNNTESEGTGQGYVFTPQQPPCFHGRPADIWAAGVTLYAFTYGRLPFDTNPQKNSGDQTPLTEIEILQDNIINAPLKLGKFLSKDQVVGTGLGVTNKLKDLLRRLLEKDPSRRIQMNELLNDPWLCKYEPMPPMNSEGVKITSLGRQFSFLEKAARNFRKMRSRAHIHMTLNRNSNKSNLGNESDSEDEFYGGPSA